MTKGIDISYHQGDIDFKKVKESGIEFAIIRQGYGLNTTDKKFSTYVKDALAAGVAVPAVYHFNYALNESEAIAEAKKTISDVESVGLPKTTVICSDLEYDSVNRAKTCGITFTKKTVSGIVKAFLDTVISLGYPVLNYMNIDYHKNWFTDEVINSYPVWLADYSGDLDFDCAVRQYSSKGKISGINTNVDLDEVIDPSIFKITATTSEKVELKSVEEIAEEVIDGKWGNGSDRKTALTSAGYDYSTIQAKVNEILNGTAVEIKEVITEVKEDKANTEVTASEKAKSFDKSFAKTYTTTANLYMRDGAGTNKMALCKIPKGSKVKCYGYYTKLNNIIWLYIRVTVDSIQYTGFSSKAYLT